MGGGCCAPPCRLLLLSPLDLEPGCVGETSRIDHGSTRALRSRKPPPREPAEPWCRDRRPGSRTSSESRAPRRSSVRARWQRSPLSPGRSSAASTALAPNLGCRQGRVLDRPLQGVERPGSARCRLSSSQCQLAAGRVRQAGDPETEQAEGLSQQVGDPETEQAEGLSQQVGIRRRSRLRVCRRRLRVCRSCRGSLRCGANRPYRCGRWICCGTGSFCRSWRRICRSRRVVPGLRRIGLGRSDERGRADEDPHQGQSSHQDPGRSAPSATRQPAAQNDDPSPLNTALSSRWPVPSGREYRTSRPGPPLQAPSPEGRPVVMASS